MTLEGDLLRAFAILAKLKASRLSMLKLVEKVAMRSNFVPVPRTLPWHQVVLLVLAGWLGASLLLDFVVMPTLYAGGMMTQSGFASTGYSLFEAFNHVELLLGAAVLTGLMVMTQQESSLPSVGMVRWRALWPALLLVAIPLLYVYGLTPYMSALGLPLSNVSLGDAATVPASMNAMHGMYWGVEGLKLSAIALLLYRLGGSFGLND